MEILSGKSNGSGCIQSSSQPFNSARKCKKLKHPNVDYSYKVG